jgi:hypothetical protein
MPVSAAFLALGIIGLLPIAAPARHGPIPHEVGPIPGSEGGRAVEIDRRSHPALARGWEAIRAGDFHASAVAGLPALGDARLLHDGGDWALVWLGEEALAGLAAAGVRVNPPRSRPAEAIHVPPPTAAPGGLPSLLYESLAAAVDQDRMMAHLEAISTDLSTRYYNTAGMQAASQYVFDRFVEYGLDQVTFDNFTHNGYAVRNVIGVKTGTANPGRITMICGHLDSTSPEAQTLAPGAEDNGSGSVGVLEAARLFGPLTTASTIYFVCFSAEEQGLVGSEHLAQRADQENWDLQGVLNMDMVGYDRPGAPDIWLEGFYGNPGSIALMDLMEDVANQYTEMSVYRYPNDGWGSDHVPFNDHGFPALLEIDYDWDNYSCYHQTCDVVANVVPSHLRPMVATVAIAGAQLAGLAAGLGGVAGHADRSDAADDGGIAIEVAGTGYAGTSTAADGSFTLADLLPGTYTLRATAAGYEAATAPVTVVAGQVTPVTLVLDPLVASIVRGRVQLLDGGYPAFARVFATGQPWGTQPDYLGDYVLDPVTPGQVIINANYAGKMPGARIVDVPSGEVVSGIDFNLESLWDFEASDAGLVANDGWAWGHDDVAGAHSGTQVWGTRLGANYQNCADYRLDLPPLDLRYYQTSRLHFWHWYRTEAGYDGGNVQVSTDGGASWTVVTPEGGYPGTMSGGCNILAGQSGFVGSGASWREAIVDLSAFAGGAIRVRFWFASDGGVRDRGWYVDDFSLEGSLLPSDVAEGSAPPEILSNVSVRPNPIESGATIRFRLGVGSPTWVSVHDATGRRVRSLLSDAPLPAGERSVAWDGLDDAGHRVSGGVYWVRVFANGRSGARSVTLLR